MNYIVFTKWLIRKSPDDCYCSVWLVRFVSVTQFRQITLRCNSRESSKVLAGIVTKYTFQKLTNSQAFQRRFSLSTFRREKCRARFASRCCLAVSFCDCVATSLNWTVLHNGRALQGMWRKEAPRWKWRL